MEIKEYNRLSKQRSRLKPEIQEKEKQYRLNNKIQESKRSKKHQQEHPDMVMLRQAKYRAKKKGLEFNLTLDDILPIPEYCPILGVKLERAFGKDLNIFTNITSPSLDRIDNTKGYTKDNVCVISMRANYMKRDMSFEEIEKLYFWMKEKFQSQS